MTVYHLVVTKDAENDLRNIAEYIAVDLLNPQASHQFLTKFDEAILELEELPFRYPLVIDESLAYRGIRKLAVDKYIVFYIVSEEPKTVTVIRILYVKRNWGTLL